MKTLKVKVQLGLVVILILTGNLTADNDGCDGESAIILTGTAALLNYSLFQTLRNSLKIL